METTLGSLFDGIGGFPLAASRYGIKTLWASEIEAPAISITKRHFPHMLHLGDITAIHSGKIPSVDIITFGSPCQDLSVAGLRNGLDGERSGLFFEAIRIIEEMREATNGRYPTFVVWENVTGALSSSNGMDFAAVLRCFTDTEIPSPDSGRWANAEMVRGRRADIAWRVLDAQFWGVPQRRRRIFLVADFRGKSAPEILFKPEGLRGNFAPRGQEKKRAARPPVLDTESADCAGFSYAVGAKAPGIGYKKGIAPTLSAQRHDAAVCYGICSDSSNSMKSSNHHSGVYQADTARTLDCNGGNPACNQGGIVVVSQSRAENIAYACGNGQANNVECAEVSGTLNCMNDQQIVLDARGNGDGRTAPPVVGDHNGRVTDYTAIAIDRAAFNQGENAKFDFGIDEDNTAFTHTAKFPQAVCASIDCRNYREGGDVFQTLQAKPGGGYSLNFSGAVRIGMVVRRLTPLECERLQGCPDNWTAYGADNKHISDSARYKAIGNSVAIPCVEYVMAGIAEALEVKQS